MPNKPLGTTNKTDCRLAPLLCIAVPSAACFEKGMFISLTFAATVVIKAARRYRSQHCNDISQNDHGPPHSRESEKD